MNVEDLIRMLTDVLVRSSGDGTLDANQHLQAIQIQATLLLVAQQTRIADVLEREEQHKEQQRGL